MTDIPLPWNDDILLRHMRDTAINVGAWSEDKPLPGDTVVRSYGEVLAASIQACDAVRLRLAELHKELDRVRASNEHA